MPITLTNPRASALTAGQFAFNGTALAANGLYQEFARYTVAAGAGWRVGSGAHNAQNTATGRFYLLLQNATPAAIPGMLRLDVMTPQDQYLLTIIQSRTEPLANGEANPGVQYALPEQGPGLTYNYALRLALKPDAAGTPDAATTSLIISMTEFDAHF